MSDRLPFPALRSGSGRRAATKRPGPTRRVFGIREVSWRRKRCVGVIDLGGIPMLPARRMNRQQAQLAAPAGLASFVAHEAGPLSVASATWPCRGSRAASRSPSQDACEFCSISTSLQPLSSIWLALLDSSFILSNIHSDILNYLFAEQVDQGCVATHVAGRPCERNTP